MRSLAEIRAFIFREPKAIKIQKRTNGEAIRFPNQKKDFSDGVFGSNGLDLANAFSTKAVQTGDVLEITTEYFPADEEGKGRRLMYLQPDEFMFEGLGGKHKFHPEKPAKNMPNIMIEGLITSWRKVGHTTPEEWSKMMEEVFGPKIRRELGTSSPEPLL